MKVKIFIALLICISMLGCSAAEESSSESTAAAATTTTVSTTSQPATTPAVTTSVTTATTTVITEEPTEETTTTPATTAEPTISDLIPEAEQTPKVDGDRLSFTISNIYSEGEYYNLAISGIKQSGALTDATTYIKEELYGDFRLELYKGEKLTDSLKINIPRDDRFLILESVTEGLSYGCELISNMRTYNTEEYPDLIQLDFYIVDEGETPQYARFFSVFNGKLTELPIYDSGIEVAPYGTHLDMLEAGIMDQHIVASTASGAYTVLRYKYTFDTAQKCLIREEIHL